MTKLNKDSNLIPSSINKRISGISAPANELKRLMSVVAPTGSSALILGPTGSGKELVAKGIHEASGKKGPLISVNCAAIPTELLESELFGHEKGAFTGAVERRDGKFLAANSGSIFLDEIGDMSPSLQAKILRVLESGEIERVGGAETIKVDVRIISATNQNLEQKISEGMFRQDLFHRINVFPITVPPLRERKEDIESVIDLVSKELSQPIRVSFTLSTSDIYSANHNFVFLKPDCIDVFDGL